MCEHKGILCSIRFENDVVNLCIAHRAFGLRHLLHLLCAVFAHTAMHPERERREEGQSPAERVRLPTMFHEQNRLSWDDSNRQHTCFHARHDTATQERLEHSWQNSADLDWRFRCAIAALFITHETLIYSIDQTELILHRFFRHLFLFCPSGSDHDDRTRDQTTLHREISAAVHRQTIAYAANGFEEVCDLFDVLIRFVHLEVEIELPSGRKSSKIGDVRKKIKAPAVSV